MKRVLIVEDDEDVRHAIGRSLESRVGTLLEASTGAEALAITAENTVDAIVLDLGLPDCDGMSTISALLRVDPACRIVVLTGRDDARAAVEALRAGAADYLTKPFERAELHGAIDRAFRDTALRREVQKAKLTLKNEGVMGSSPTWMRVLEDLRAIAECSRASALLSGESGTGKEALARLLHRWSPRAAGPFVTVNAACLPAQLLESELFGHEAGAFTDARTARKGLFELAHGGTLFIDEIGEFQLELQPKLLRVLEGHSFRRVGGQREIFTDVRLVSATNRNLQAMVAAGTFREDFYFRIGVLQLSLPPLRERSSDIPELAAHFIATLGSEKGLSSPALVSRVIAQLTSYSWPGNVRELRNVIERALVLSRGGDIDLHHLPPQIGGKALSSAARSPALLAAATPARAEAATTPADITLENVIRRHILAIYEANKRNVTHTASALGISRVALRRHLRQYVADDDPTMTRAGAPEA